MPPRGSSQDHRASHCTTQAVVSGLHAAPRLSSLQLNRDERDRHRTYMGYRATVAHMLSYLHSSCCWLGSPRPTQKLGDELGGLSGRHTACGTTCQPATGTPMSFDPFFATPAASSRPPWAFGGSTREFLDKWAGAVRHWWEGVWSP
ncbi:hypothetical protein NDU88_000347 [Pleurodeles waltl]|uniref:Uncharacterized protein n=1 Tax=Pleurodeles waltl TaxID=8319 RepID=A0AAV7U391_PLEWA|nr:hypothetical protein NDU88_000347 [Pleurodeles waltl]